MTIQQPGVKPQMQAPEPPAAAAAVVAAIPGEPRRRNLTEPLARSAQPGPPPRVRVRRYRVSRFILYPSLPCWLRDPVPLSYREPPPCPPSGPPLPPTETMRATRPTRTLRRRPLPGPSARNQTTVASDAGLPTTTYTRPPFVLICPGLPPYRIRYLPPLHFVPLPRPPLTDRHPANGKIPVADSSAQPPLRHPRVATVLVLVLILVD
jgi:hypothetical protein